MGRLVAGRPRRSDIERCSGCGRPEEAVGIGPSAPASSSVPALESQPRAHDPKAESSSSTLLPPTCSGQEKVKLWKKFEVECLAAGVGMAGP